jgi:hypothetical protein
MDLIDIQRKLEYFIEKKQHVRFKLWYNIWADRLIETCKSLTHYEKIIINKKSERFIQYLEDINRNIK